MLVGISYWELLYYSKKYTCISVCLCKNVLTLCKYHQPVIGSQSISFPFIVPMLHNLMIFKALSKIFEK